ncbi:alpha/beta fold hydrolase, partial [Escherichia coli]|nr:alpha/beta fold hydrolase [Escherichia coli]
LSVGDGHWLYVEEIGSPGGTPALFLHGGPGSGSQHFHRRLFDPDRFHAFLFDQRGAGRSHPYLSLNENTTQTLVADIEAIREHYGIAIDVLSPDPRLLEPLVKEKGLFSFYRDGHGECCGIRKIEPLKR